MLSGDFKGENSTWHAQQQIARMKGSELEANYITTKPRQTTDDLRQTGRTEQRKH